jgi:hypothetical protein
LHHQSFVMKPSKYITTNFMWSYCWMGGRSLLKACECDMEWKIDQSNSSIPTSFVFMWNYCSFFFYFFFLYFVVYCFIGNGKIIKLLLLFLFGCWIEELILLLKPYKAHVCRGANHKRKVVKPNIILIANQQSCDSRLTLKVALPTLHVSFSPL